MSKSIGILQRNALDHLSKQGRWCYANDVIHSVYKHTQAPEAENFSVPLSFDSSMRRALRSMEKRGLVMLGEKHEGLYRGRDDAYKKLAVWLPEHAAPAVSRNKSGQQIEEMILSGLDSLTPSEIADAIRYGAKPAQSALREPGAIPYSLLVSRIIRVLGCDRWSRAWAYTAINRAVKRLDQRGEIKSSRYRNGRYGWIKDNR